MSLSENYSKSLSLLSLALKLACEGGRWSTTFFAISPSDTSVSQSKFIFSDSWSKNLSLASLCQSAICLIISLLSSLKNDDNDSVIQTHFPENHYLVIQLTAGDGSVLNGCVSVTALSNNLARCTVAFHILMVWFFFLLGAVACASYDTQDWSLPSLPLYHHTGAHLLDAV